MSVLPPPISRCTSAPSVETLAGWQKEIDQLATRFANLRDERVSSAKESYTRVLRDRHQAAINAGDDVTAAYYEQALQEASGAPK